MKKLLIIAAILLTGCTSQDQSNRALGSAGYTNIQFTGYHIFGCDKNDSFHTGFKATGVNGKPVEGVVCSGWFKGATIRLD
jgi:hypothetical protein